MRKLLIPTIAALIFIGGLVSLLLPFIPLGWLLIALSSLLMAPYFKVMRKFIGWLATIDKTGFVEKAGEKASHLYEWAGDPKRAEELKTIIEENSKDDGQKTAREE
ncbi:hypothetical protein [Algoriphagus winogradskyi]|uniref:hypothetical protein n=1 Tax=Algoriphagus winogradskyi TaxID=237017 RepID=UPI0024B803CD|nr:hypothetical protein [Algoriphagus winogradskyi]